MPDKDAVEVPMVGGIVSSSKIPGIHLIPTEGLLRTAARFDLGVERKKKKSWNALSSNQECLTDRAWVIERIGHVIHHAMKLRDRVLGGKRLLGDGVDDDAAAIGWSAMFLCSATRALDEQQNKVLLNCSACGGAGVFGNHDQTCPACRGAGKSGGSQL